MKSDNTLIKRTCIDGFDVQLNTQFFSEDNPSILTSLKKSLASAKKISHGKDYVVTSSIELNGRMENVAIKIFTKQALLKDLIDRKKGSKAARSFEAANYLIGHGINTPTPIACLDKWQGNRLVESYFIAIFEPAICLRDALFSIYHHEKDSAQLMELLFLVAPAIKKMHDAGFMHGDMGNQNILLPRNPDGSWGSPSFIDLNRYSINPEGLNNKQRAFDLSRPLLPGNYLHFFMQIYCGNQDYPTDLAQFQHRYRRNFTWHRNSRKFRHPLRHLKNKYFKNNLQAKPQLTYPEQKNYWLWDEKTAQPMIALSKTEKHKERVLGDVFRSLMRNLLSGYAVYKEYQRLKQQDYSAPIAMQGRVGVALHPHSEYIQHEVTLLQQLGNPPVLIRFCRHESPQIWDATIALIQQLHTKGVQISVALIQDRDAVIEPAKWSDFLETIIPNIEKYAANIEITHAYNRIKWGIWSLQELNTLLSVAIQYKRKYPHINIIGPACIDFEFAAVISALKEVEKIDRNFQFDALSHLLYVDRRGAPENKQGRFSTLEKSRLLKAIANTLPGSKNKVIVSEVNWPIENTGVWSPIVCPYETAKWQNKPSGEPEAAYANYMLRYLAITLCSGHVEQVFWWRLSAHGYGLVDDKNQFTPRPAFYALAHFLKLLSNATFTRKLPSENSVYLMEFSREGQQILMGWSTQHEPQVFSPPWQPDVIYNAYGEIITDTTLTSSPKYFIVG